MDESIDESNLGEYPNQTCQGQMFLTADAQSVLDISNSIHQETLLLLGHSCFNHHQVYTLEDGFKGDAHLFQTWTDLLESHIKRIVEQGVHDAVQVLRTWISCEIIDCLTLNGSFLVHHRQRLNKMTLTWSILTTLLISPAHKRNTASVPCSEMFKCSDEAII